MEQNSRHDWQERQIIEILQKPFNDLIFETQTVHRQYFNPNVTILMQSSYRHSSQLRPGRVLKIVNIVANPLTTN